MDTSKYGTVDALGAITPISGAVHLGSDHPRCMLIPGGNRALDIDWRAGELGRHRVEKVWEGN